MGYKTHVTGELAINPPLTWAEIKNSIFDPADLSDSQNVMLAITEERVDTDEGVLIRRTGTAIVSRWEESFKAYHLVEHVQMAIDAFPDHEWTGRLECEGEENTDVWRVIVRDRRAVKIEPRIVWPDEEA
ncbi:DUF6205 family protein [Streptomyces sp. NPDC087850]|uniref:DUF6205 family protein n=1 Tax=Streptomyces sp. NPDC087850 TaxID=3365809 RepID=UPI00382DDA70